MKLNRFELAPTSWQDNSPLGGKVAVTLDSGVKMEVAFTPEQSLMIVQAIAEMVRPMIVGQGAQVGREKMVQPQLVIEG